MKNEKKESLEKTRGLTGYGQTTPMSNWDIFRYHEVALEKAIITFQSSGRNFIDSDILSTAEKYYNFLTEKKCQTSNNG